jgi:hypothetical protein
MIFTDKMAICTKCGAIFSDEDEANHVCNPEDIPQKGETLRSVTTTSE